MKLSMKKLISIFAITIFTVTLAACGVKPDVTVKNFLKLRKNKTLIQWVH